MRSWIRSAVVFAASAFVVMFPAGCSTDTEDPTFDNPFDPTIGDGLPVPTLVSVTVGDNVVHLSWSLEEGETADEYGIFRRRTDGDVDEEERLIKRVTEPSYQDSGVRNGRDYVYRIAAGRNGQFGRRTDEVEARPALFTISLQGDQRVTRDRNASITFAAGDAEAVQISEDPEAFDDPWRAATGTVTWSLSPGDGEKVVYARFRLSDGSETLPARGRIRLDTKAVIESVAFDGSSIRAAGDVIHFRLNADETYGAATISVDDVFSDVPLFDDGSNGDTVADDGIYERNLTIPVTAAALNERVLGKFTDEAGNVAVDLTASNRLSVQNAPDAVDLFSPVPAEPPAEVSLALRWSQSTSHEFGSYKLLRSESTPVDSTDKLITTVTSASTIDYTDADVIEGETYYYRVYLTDHLGQETGSNIVRADVPNVRPPAAVTVSDPAAVTTNRVVLEWTKVADTDFLVYRVYRNETGAVSDSDDLISTISDIDQAFLDDDGLLEDTTYYYRVYAVDTGGLTSRSNEVHVSTQNDIPTAVTLETPSATSPSRIALEWTRSTDTDFQSYRVYRNESGTVTDADPLIIVVTDLNQVFWDDSGLRENTSYFYRVYTSDASGLTARSNEVEGVTSNEPPDAVSLNGATNVDSTAATLSWDESSVHDFDSYGLYRSEIPTVTRSSSLVVEIDESSATSFRDAELSSDTTYYYRVFVVDDAPESEAAGSNIITVTTP